MDVVSLAQAPELVECFRHEGDGCLRCDGSGYRPRKRCVGCGEPAKALQTAQAAKSGEEARTLPLYTARAATPASQAQGWLLLD